MKILYQKRRRSKILKACHKELERDDCQDCEKMTTEILNGGAASGKISAHASDVESFSTTRSAVSSNPFGSTADPYSIKSGSYTSANTVISQALFSVVEKVFSYETVGSENLLDSQIQLWVSHYQKKNAFGVVPNFYRFQVRSGASSALLGYFSHEKKKVPLTVLAGSNALTYMQPTLAASSAKIPIAFNISAIDFDANEDVFFSNYLQVLGAARSLGYPVITPTSTKNGLELQHLSLLNYFIASVSQSPSVFLFDGPDFAREYLKFENLLSVEELGNLYRNLLGSWKEENRTLRNVVEAAFEVFNKLAGTNYSHFEYSGSANAETVFVSYGSKEGAELSNVIEKVQDAKIGLIRVRVPLPFSAHSFLLALPSSTRKIVVIGQINNDEVSTSSPLKADITAALFLSGQYHNYTIEEFTYSAGFIWTPVVVTKVLNEFGLSLNPYAVLKNTEVQKPIDVNANSSPVGEYLIWGSDNGKFLDLGNKLALSLSLDNTKYVSVRTKFDNALSGGLFQSQIRSSFGPISESVDAANVVLLDNVSILNDFDILATAAPGANVLIGHWKPIKNSVEEDIIPGLPVEFRRGLARGKSSLTLVDFSVLEEIEASDDSTKGFSEDFLMQLAFWNAAYPELGDLVVNKLLQANGGSFELLASVVDKFVHKVYEKKALKNIEVLPEWADLKDEEVEPEAEQEKQEEELKKEVKFFPSENSLYPNPRAEGENQDEVAHTGYRDLATRLVFPDAYESKKELRPDLPVKNFVVKVQENRRLTPAEYNRNIFHIEFDITGTGLTYDIGEALGIHGRNNEDAVEEFLRFYNVDGDSLVEVPNKEDSSVLELRTARQTLRDSVDFLGKPPKRFYEALSEFADDEKEREHLQKLGGAEGAEELKKRQDVDFCTFVDILEEFPSARPSFGDLVKIITPLKRREYSIASSQKMHPNSVHLLIVVVDWIDLKGRKRFGHCSKYLSDLAIGDELVVSVKPSVMKLPPLSTQPIVMSGLGTGLAPFKAFIEEKLWQKANGMEIGEIYLFMGSRHKKEEYLYGELWEAYKDAGVLTHIGAAFSRDQPEKIYIQDKIRESIENLTDAIVNKNGSFYLCGPTWPVPDITACLEDIVSTGAKRIGQTIKDVSKVVEDMKEEGRYILEVY